MPASTKVIVTNNGALKEKYGAPALARIHAALDRLAAADRSRGISTRIVALDSATDMKAAGGVARLRSVRDEPGTKKAIDAIFKKLVPDYLVIVGAPDVVTYQSLTNPVRDRGAPGDPDRVVPSDLPYACDAPHGSDPRDFIRPTRVVGRIPDLENWKNPAYLLSLLTAATAAIARAASDRANDAEITAHVARRFSLLERSGAMVGTVVASGCGYGAQPYDPATTVGGMGIASRHLGRGACGYLGSTTTAYGPSKRGGSADLMCRYFLRRVNKGASVGRAMLEARQHFVATSQKLDPVDLKTLAQFNLLGDPSFVRAMRDASAQQSTWAFRAHRDGSRKL